MCARGTLRRTGSDHPIRKPPKRRTWVSNYGPARPGVWGGGDRHNYDGVRQVGTSKFPGQRVGRWWGKLVLSRARGTSAGKHAATLRPARYASYLSTRSFKQTHSIRKPPSIRPSPLPLPSSPVSCVRRPKAPISLRRGARRCREVLLDHLIICCFTLLARG